jgi:hypothetical protein
MEMNKCLDCRKEFINARQLHRHQKSHATVMPYACDLCERRFHRKDGLLQHRLASHPQNGKPQFPCTFCELSFKHRASLLRHVKKEHPQQHGSGLHRKDRSRRALSNAANIRIAATDVTTPSQLSTIPISSVALAPALVPSTPPLPRSSLLPSGLSRLAQGAEDMGDLNANEMDLLNEISELDLLVAGPKSPSLLQAEPPTLHRLSSTVGLDLTNAMAHSHSRNTSQGYFDNPGDQETLATLPSTPAFHFAPPSVINQSPPSATPEQVLTAMVKPLLSNVLNLLASRGPQHASSLPELSAMLSNPALYALVFPQ